MSALSFEENMNRKINFVFLFIILVFISFTMTACRVDMTYLGNYLDLYSVAINSVDGLKGFIHSEIGHPSVVELIETDSYGRSLFVYCEEDYREHSIVYLMISQGRTTGGAIFYSGINYIYDALSDNNVVHIFGHNRSSYLEHPLNDFTESEIEELKSKNDWNQPLNYAKCKTVSIVWQKSDVLVSKPNAQSKPH